MAPPRLGMGHDDSMSSPPPIVVSDPNLAPPALGPDGLPIKPKKKRKRPEKKKDTLTSSTGSLDLAHASQEKGDKPGTSNH